MAERQRDAAVAARLLAATMSGDETAQVMLYEQVQQSGTALGVLSELAGTASDLFRRLEAVDPVRAVLLGQLVAYAREEAI